MLHFLSLSNDDHLHVVRVETDRKNSASLASQSEPAPPAQLSDI